jgi:uncharacterized damage-inducible protein DinB
MSAEAEVRDMLALTRKYYARLRELLAQVPAGKLEWRPAPDHLSAEETLRHVCEADRWYMELLGHGAAPTDDTESTMCACLASLDEAALERTAVVPGWWGEGRPQPARLILIQSLAHKYYHCGQLQALLHTLAGD